MTSEIQNGVRAVALSQVAALEADCERVAQPILGHHMVWRRVGHGPPLVLLHGGHGCWLHWARVIPELSSSFSVWMPDMPGYGEATLAPTGGLDELVTQLRQSLDTRHGGRRRQNTSPLPWHDLDPDRDPGQWAQRIRHNLLAQMLHSEAAVDALAVTAAPHDMTDDLAPGGAHRQRLIVGGAGHWLMHECPANTASLMKSGFDGG